MSVESDRTHRSLRNRAKVPFVRVEEPRPAQRAPLAKRFDLALRAPVLHEEGNDPGAHQVERIRRAACREDLVVGSELHQAGVAGEQRHVAVLHPADQRVGPQLVINGMSRSHDRSVLPTDRRHPAVDRQYTQAVADIDPAHFSETPYQDHIGPQRQYVRDIILGVNDGLVSIFLLIAGVVGGGLGVTEVLLTGIAGALAGAVSMASGEYLATKSQHEVFQAEMALEKVHLAEHREYERAELREMFRELGVPEDRLDELVDIIDSSDEAMMGVMGALEFGVVDTEARSPYLAAVASGLLFLAGALPSVLPFFFVSEPVQGLVIAGFLAGIGLFAVGAFKTALTKRSAIVSGFENLAIGLVGGVISYLVGVAFGVAVS